MPSGRAQWIMVGVVVPVLIAVLTSPFWTEMLFGGPGSGPGPTTTAPPPTLIGASSRSSQPKTISSPTSPGTRAGIWTTPSENSPAAIYLSRDSGPVGTLVLVSGTGFRPSESIDVVFSTRPCARTTADSTGKFSQTACAVPNWYSHFPDTDFSITATGRTSLLSDSRPFHVT